MTKEIEISISPESFQNPNKLKRAIMEASQLKEEEIGVYEIIRKSIDSRRHPAKYRIKLRVGLEKKSEIIIPNYQNVSSSKTVIIIGAGPAGLFSALKLIEKGFKPIILERGKEVSERKKDIAILSKSQILNPESNWCFGEGGAGTFSDGKLFTRSNKKGNIREILETFVNHGAEEEILYEAHPHIGTDRLSRIIKNIRERIEEKGGEYRFETKVIDIIEKDKKAIGVRTSKGEEIFASAIILATGHSARDIYYMFDNKKWALEAKDFAVGVRIEHPQELINHIQYHSKKYSSELPPATYTLAQSLDNNRGVFSFCMCPGGIIVPSATDNKQSVVNGMSNSLRNSPYANSGIVVNVNKDDAKDFQEYGNLALLKFQEDLERKFYFAADKTQAAPSQRLIDFLNSKPSNVLNSTSYLCGLISYDLNKLFPKFISESLKLGFKSFDKKMKGFISENANLIGLESRTSSSVRIPRDPISLEHIEISNLYPCGEGSGYSGGITSSAIDGVRIAEIIAEKYQ